jgi:signal-transduction protein with cAMP-binding, CBS, and nucleotidyltransferase domain
MQLFLSKKGNKDTVKSWEICTHKILEVGLDATVRQVAELMTKNHVHHIIVTSNGVIVGMVSTIDIIQHYLLA